MTTSTPTSRLLSLLSLLQARREWSGGELAERLEVSPRTIRRDVGRLRELGYPIESRPGPTGRYVLAAGAAMPPLLLDDEEAVAVAIALRTAARSAVADIEETAVRALLKLEQVLPAHLRRRVQAFGQATSILPAGGGPTVDPARLVAIAGACRERETLRLRYQARDGERSARVVEPHALVALGRRWYLVAFDPARKGWRTFRVDRMSALSPSGTRFAERQIPGGDASRFVSRTISAAVYRYEAVVTYAAPAEAVRARAGGWGKVEPLDEHSCVLRTSDDDLDWLAFRIGMAGADFTVEGPPELYEALAKLGQRFAQACARAPGGRCRCCAWVWRARAPAG